MELEKALEKAWVATQAKSNFLATMSYEIRTPMNTVMGMTRILERSRLDDSQKGLVDKISTSGKHLLVVISDLLDFSKIEAGVLKLENSPFSIDDLIEQVSITLRPSAAEKGLSLHIQKIGIIDPIYISDYFRICQVVLNLASNAIKYTDNGAVSLNLSTDQLTQPALSGKKQALLVIEVNDTGKGMDSVTLNHLFDAFLKSEMKTSGAYNGLGLSISRKLCRAMGGDIRVESTENVGSSFVATFKVSVLQGEELKLWQDRVERENQLADKASLLNQEVKVLVAEDNIENRELIEFMLEDIGVSFKVVADGRQVLNELLDHNNYNLILMDCLMPVMDGYEATRRIRHGEVGSRYKDIPIIACTANVMQDDIDRCIGEGMNAYLSKPIDEGVLIDKLANAISAFDDSR